MLGDNIRRIRKTLKISINKLSEISGVSIDYLSDLENNISINPTMETLFKIAEVLNVSLLSLLEDPMDPEDKVPEQTSNMRPNLKDLKVLKK